MQTTGSRREVVITVIPDERKRPVDLRFRSRQEIRDHVAECMRDIVQLPDDGGADLSVMLRVPQPGDVADDPAEDDEPEPEPRRDTRVSADPAQDDAPEPQRAPRAAIATALIGMPSMSALRALAMDAWERDPAAVEASLTLCQEHGGTFGPADCDACHGERRDTWVKAAPGDEGERPGPRALVTLTPRQCPAGLLRESGDWADACKRDAGHEPPHRSEHNGDWDDSSPRHLADVDAHKFSGNGDGDPVVITREDLADLRTGGPPCSRDGCKHPHGVHHMAARPGEATGHCLAEDCGCEAWQAPALCGAERDGRRCKLEPHEGGEHDRDGWRWSDVAHSVLHRHGVHPGGYEGCPDVPAYPVAGPERQDPGGDGGELPRRAALPPCTRDGCGHPERAHMADDEVNADGPCLDLGCQCLAYLVPEAAVLAAVRPLRPAATP